MHFLLTLIVQIAVILSAAWVVGYLFRRIGQPQVVGEMMAGILLGPSLLGWVAPDLSAALFPVESLGYLNALSQIGLLLFMFLIGLELDPKLLRGRGHAALVTSHTSIIVPFFLGALLALYLYPRLSDARVGFTGFALFMGAAMSVTAFPVLARILTERNLLRTKMGAVTIACAAVDDVTAWCILAVVIAVVRSGEAMIPLWLTITGSAAFILVMVFPVRHALTRLERFYHSRGRLTRDAIVGILLLLLASAWTTEWLGIHALFGAFTLGAVMPKDRGFVHDLTGKLEDVAVAFLLPLFFAFTGLRTSIGLVSGAEMWFYCFLILGVAVAGKFGGSALAARATGLSWRESGALGILMNTRGLMELVILTIGLDLGVISPALFAMMVFMALVTTFMTTPLLEWIYPLRLIREQTVGEAEDEKQYTVVVPVALPSSGPGLLRVAAASGPTPQVYALHLVRAEERALGPVPVPELPSQSASLRPLLDAATDAGVSVRPLAFATRDAGADIVDVSHAKGADLILMGWHKPILGQSILSGTVYEVLRRAQADVGVYVERHFAPWRRILVPFRSGVHDRAALALAGRLAQHSGAELTILHVVEPGTAGTAERLRATLPGEAAGTQTHLHIVESARPLDVAVEVAKEHFDLVVIGLSEAWGLEPALFSGRHERLAQESPASLLIVRKHVPAEAPAVAAPLAASMA